jgi:hypothetical protein
MAVTRAIDRLIAEMNSDDPQSPAIIRRTSRKTSSPKRKASC